MKKPEIDSFFLKAKETSIDSTNFRSIIKLLNTFLYYNKCFSESEYKEHRKFAEFFDSTYWNSIKIKYDFKWSNGGGYYSKQLNITYGGSIPNDYFIIVDFHDCLDRIKEKYIDDL